MKKLFQKNGSGRHWSIKKGQTVIFESGPVIIDSVIAYGGYSVIFSVKRKKSNCMALKKTSVTDEASMNSCIMEINVMKKCAHPNIIQFIDSSLNKVDHFRSEVFLLMEHCPKSLVQLLQQNFEKGLKEDQILKILKDVCQGLAVLHGHSPPIINRDLKAENVLINSNGDFVLCDFGSAVFETLPDENLNSSTISHLEEEIAQVTTFAYRSPEMVDLYCGEHITCKADIWALGCLLFKLCFLTMPFEENNLAILSGRFTFPKTICALFRGIIENCLQVSPGCRPNVNEILTALVTKEFCQKFGGNSEKLAKIERIKIPDDVFVAAPFDFPPNPWPMDESSVVTEENGQLNPFMNDKKVSKNKYEDGCVNEYFIH